LAKAADTWQEVLGKIEQKLSPHSFSTWFRPTQFLSEDSSSISVRVPNSWFAEWLTTHYQPYIKNALHELDRPGIHVRFLTDDERRGPHAVPAGGGWNSGPAGDDSRPAAAMAGDGVSARPVPAPASNAPVAGSWLNPRYTFDTFVVSSCNQFAHAAAMAVAGQPTRSYNPLFIYGGVGLGKTHLMQAIGNRLHERGVRMRYISSEQFMNELINAIRFEKTLEFKGRYRNVELLLIDDIQFLAGKERTQEEFFHTFNTLYDSQRQIVITSDCPPRDIPTLEERLRSRFEWGLIADIQPPDLETKIAILRKKAENERVDLPDDVALFIASHSKENIRELEGALIRVIAFASMTRSEITLDLARQTLRDVLDDNSPAVTVESIQKLVANYFDLKVSVLKSKNNSQQIAFPRQIAMYLCKRLTQCSLPDIGRRFSGKHHSTVIHAINKIEQKRVKEREFDRLIQSFIQSLS
jgi:chromosomal replication initiator protein